LDHLMADVFQRRMGGSRAGGPVSLPQVHNLTCRALPARLRRHPGRAVRQGSGDDRHGLTSELTRAEIDDLVAFVGERVRRQMRTFGNWAGALLLGAALGTGCDGGPLHPTAKNGPDAAGGSDGAGDMAQSPACVWAPAAPELTLAEGEVKGVLRGSSRNLSTTCTGQKGTGGPEAIYLVRLTERTLLDIEVVSEMDTVLAIRRACHDPLTEVACSDDTGANSPLPLPGLDAGAPLPGPDARNAHLRASLEAGNYFLLVDQA
jgi:hypothetical protein